MNIMENGRFSRVLPLLLLAAWVCAVGWFMWTRAQQSITPPGPDPLSYMQKAKNTWENARQGFPMNPLKVEQPLRPPGTTLISFPFGYDGDHRAFYFRTVFIPFLVWTLAVLLACWPIAGQWGRSGLWPVVGAAILFGANPFFFQFESHTNAIVAWGFMDQALGACAGFAMAAVRRSTQTRSRILLAIGVLMACFSLMVKPTGSLVLLFTAAYFVGSECLRILRIAPSERRRESSLLIFGMAAFLIMGGGLTLLSLKSPYIGGGTKEKMIEALKFLRVLSNGVSWRDAVRMRYSFLGLQGLLPAVAILTTMAVHTFRGKKPSDRFDIAFLMSLLGLGYLLHMLLLGGASQMRYYSPFVFMGLAILLGWAARRWRDVYRVALGSPARAWATLAATLLSLATTYKVFGQDWQRILGVSLHIKKEEESEDRLSRWLQARYRETGREPVVFINTRNSLKRLTSLGSNMRAMVEPEARSYRTLDIYTWDGYPHLDLKKMLYESDLVLVSYEDWMPAIRDSRKVPITDFDFGNEIHRTSHLIYRLALDGKVKTVWKDGDLRLYAIPDKRRFLADFDSAFTGADWSDAFIKGNGVVNGKVHPFDTLSTSIPYPPGDTASAAGEGSLDLFDGQPPGKDTLRAADVLRLQGWLAAAAPKGIPAEAVFVTIDGPGGITRFGPVKRVPRPDVVSAFGHASLLHSGFETNIGLLDLEGSYSLGLAYVKDGRWYRLQGLRRPLLVMRDAGR